MNIEIANRLQKLRKEHGFSQEELASKLNVSRQAVSKWETTESSPDTDNLIALSKLYGISLDELLGISVPNKKEEKSEIIDNGKRIEINIDTEDDDQIDKRSSKIIKIIDVIICGLTLVFYIVFSSITGLWHPTWLVVFIPPIVAGTLNSIISKKIHVFPFALLMTAIYLFIGFIFKIWHPTWVLFCLIPFFSLIANLFNNKKRK